MAYFPLVKQIDIVSPPPSKQLESRLWNALLRAKSSEKERVALGTKGNYRILSQVNILSVESYWQGEGEKMPPFLGDTDLLPTKLCLQNIPLTMGKLAMGLASTTSNCSVALQSTFAPKYLPSCCVSSEVTMYLSHLAFDEEGLENLLKCIARNFVLSFGLRFSWAKWHIVLPTNIQYPSDFFPSPLFQAHPTRMSPQEVENAREAWIAKTRTAIIAATAQEMNLRSSTPGIPSPDLKAHVNAVKAHLDQGKLEFVFVNPGDPRAICHMCGRSLDFVERTPSDRQARLERQAG